MSKKIQFNYRKLRGRIVEKFGTCGAFAKKIGIYKQTLSAKLNGDIGITKEDIIEWSEILEIEKEEIGVFFFTLKA